ncbi:hypothetical protein [Massiliimalia massiliensis]|uniref:hypothetical protein n=1 Tax=Massiliimalia massiliensis TaxID=1852384 RepID=UPI000984E16A|nr:hypothetical protein [Massiliimalia massiliensis]
MKKCLDPYTSSIEGYLSRTEQLEKLEREISVYPTEHPIYTCSQYETLFQNNIVPSSFSKCRDMILDFMQYHNETAYLYGISMGIMNLPDKENLTEQYSIAHNMYVKQFQRKLEKQLRSLWENGDTDYFKQLYLTAQAVDKRLQIDQIGYILLGWQNGIKRSHDYSPKQYDHKFEDYCKQQMQWLNEHIFCQESIGILSDIFEKFLLSHQQLDDSCAVRL